MPKPNTTVTKETQVKPDPQLEKRTRRKFTAEYKLDILAQADVCKHGELGALLRREKLYSNQLSQWRREYAVKGVAGLDKSQPGPRASKTQQERQNEQLRKENERLKRKLEIANDCIDLQKKALSMLDRLRNGNAA